MTGAQKLGVQLGVMHSTRLIALGPGKIIGALILLAAFLVVEKRGNAAEDDHYGDHEAEQSSPRVGHGVQLGVDVSLASGPGDDPLRKPHYREHHVGEER
jgi:hypothetical protein